MNNIIKTFLILVMGLVLFCGCGRSYNITVDLTPEEIQSVKDEITDLKEQIANYEGEEGTIANMEIVGLSRAYEKLGDIDTAIKVYEDVLKTGKKTRVIIHNLGRLYENAGEYETAIRYYTRLVDEYNDPEYHYYITNVYILMKDPENAEKHFNIWQREYHATDLQMQQQIQKLREEESKSE